MEVSSFKDTSDLEKIKDIFDRQSKPGANNAWIALKYEQKECEPGFEDILLHIDHMNLCFVFSPEGSLRGMFNWQE